MATTFNSGAIDRNSAFKPFPSGNVGIRTAEYAIGAALVINDVVQMCNVFAGETVLGVTITSTDLDTGGSPALVLDVGYGGASAGTADDMINGSLIGRAGGASSSFAVGDATTGDGAVAPKTFAADETIDIHVKAAPATGATTGTLTMTLYIA
jgi:hypothetical protein